jgi:hypothetical protein
VTTPGGRPPPGRVVPVFALTGGRTRSGGRALPIESLVTLTSSAATASTRSDLDQEYRTILGIAQRLVSIAEIGAALRVPVGVARVLVTDLADAGLLVVHAPPPTGADGRPDTDVLVRLLEGLRAR